MNTININFKLVYGLEISEIVKTLNRDHRTKTKKIENIGKIRTKKIFFYKKRF